MNGAPQGDLFEAVVLDTHDLPVSGDVQRDLQVSVC